MNTGRLLSLYDRVADAPDAVPRLRRFILDLAVRGKLVEQDLSDEPVSGRLNVARTALEEKARTTKRVRWQPSKSVAPEPVASETPPGWAHARVNDTGLYINGLAFKPSDWHPDGLPIIRIQNLTDPSKGFHFARGEFPKEVLVNRGDILVSWSATLDAFKWQQELGVLNQHIFRVIPCKELVGEDYLYLLLRHAIRDMAKGKHAHGLVMTHINRGPFLNHVVLIPPLAEQHRIVAKVDELIALCDELEGGRIGREETRDRLTTAIFSGLTAPDTDAPTFRARARRAVGALPALTARANQIKHLRRTILDLAVRGKLVEQDPSDDPASELLNQIAAEKGRLDTDGRRRARTRSRLLDADAAPFPIPKSWSWAQMRDIAICLDHMRRPINASERARRISGKRPDTLYPYYGATQRQGWIDDFLFDEELVLLGEDGVPFLDPLRPKAYIIRGKSWVNNHAHVFRGVTVSNAYLVHALNVFDYGSRIVGATRAKLNQARALSIPIPIPPLAEQQRVVAKINELMSLCDRLEAGLNEADIGQQQLLKALLQDALQSSQQQSS